ncbi:MAG: DUF4258 domain-containing protein [Helicobacteraceae bacterium]|nr:DUF4258 domain-containing protein [Helicobacteraceae bacterium]
MLDSKTFFLIKELVLTKKILISSHGYDELAEDGIFLTDVLASIEEAIVVEDYPNAYKGASVLLLQLDRDHNPIHTVWGVPKGKSEPAVLITSYKPSPTKWDTTFTRRAENE